MPWFKEKRKAWEKEHGAERKAKQRAAKKLAQLPDAENWEAPQCGVVLASDFPPERNVEKQEATLVAADAVRERLNLIKALCQRATTKVGSGPLKTHEYIDCHNIIRPMVKLRANAGEYSPMRWHCDSRRGNVEVWRIHLTAIQAQFRVLTPIAYTFEDEKKRFNFPPHATGKGTARLQ